MRAGVMRRVNKFDTFLMSNTLSDLELDQRRRHLDVLRPPHPIPRFHPARHQISGEQETVCAIAFAYCL
jgi:hypothetical protein